MNDFVSELTSLLNRHCKENGSGTPDFILAEYLFGCLTLWCRIWRLVMPFFGCCPITRSVWGSGTCCGGSLSTSTIFICACTRLWYTAYAHAPRTQATRSTRGSTCGC